MKTHGDRGVPFSEAPRHGIQHSTSNLGALELGKQQDDEIGNQSMKDIQKV